MYYIVLCEIRPIISKGPVYYKTNYIFRKRREVDIEDIININHEYFLGLRVIGISGSLIWSKTLVELIFNPYGKFR